MYRRCVGVAVVLSAKFTRVKRWRTIDVDVYISKGLKGCASRKIEKKRNNKKKKKKEKGVDVVEYKIRNICNSNESSPIASTSHRVSPPSSLSISRRRRRRRRRRLQHFSSCTHTSRRFRYSLHIHGALAKTKFTTFKFGARHFGLFFSVSYPARGNFEK